MIKPKLFAGQERFAWHARPWTDFADTRGPHTTAILPVCGLTDWGLGRPLDAEEVVACAILDHALDSLAATTVPLVLPPFRHLPAQHPGMAAALDIEFAHRSVSDIARSVRSSGIDRMILFNSNPFCEEWIDVAARDLRIELGLQTFCINLSGLGLDFHSGRSPDTSVLQSILSLLLGEEPDAADTFPQTDPLADLLLAVENPPADPSCDAESHIERISQHLTSLLFEILQHPPLRKP